MPETSRSSIAWFSRVASLLGIAEEGVRILLIPVIVAIAALLLGIIWLTIILLAIAFAIGMFFRDPERFPAVTEGVVLSGADGKVCNVGEGAPPGLADTGRFHRVSVFMSPLDVHVNRAPVSGEVMAVNHTPGIFRAAFSDEASELNERNLIVLSDSAGRRHAMVQVAGYLARRIICWLHPRDRASAGARIGLIMFGSRVDHFIPLDYRITVNKGDRVRAGESVIGELLQ
ncbi:MAG: phosphatidylserine decarboxylase [Candidatus Binataceae bacterium]